LDTAGRLAGTGGELKASQIVTASALSLPAEAFRAVDWRDGTNQGFMRQEDPTTCALATLPTDTAPARLGQRDTPAPAHRA
jgi:hypothetical protein